MLASRTRALLDRYALASRALSRVGGELSAVEPGHSVEFHDFRPYQPGDELRYVDWRVYARTGRLYTRLYQAERAVQLHLVLDDSASMGQGGKLAYARTLVRLLSYVAQRDAPTQVHLLMGGSTPRARGRRSMLETWRFIDSAQPQRATAPGLAGARGDGRSTEPATGAPLAAAAPVASADTLSRYAGSGPLSGLVRFAAGLPALQGRALVLVVSDLLEDTPIEPSLAALRARGVDVAFLQVLAEEELDPPSGLVELYDVETGEKLPVGPDEARAYREEVRAHVRRTRAAILRAGYRHQLLVVPAPEAGAGRAAGARPRPVGRAARLTGAARSSSAAGQVATAPAAAAAAPADAAGERVAFAALVRLGLLVKR